jgi:hypothetical protein
MKAGRQKSSFPPKPPLKLGQPVRFRSIERRCPPCLAVGVGTALRPGHCGERVKEGFRVGRHNPWIREWLSASAAKSRSGAHTRVDCPSGELSLAAFHATRSRFAAEPTIRRPQSHREGVPAQLRCPSALSSCHASSCRSPVEPLGSDARILVEAEPDMTCHSYRGDRPTVREARASGLPLNGELPLGHALDRHENVNQPLAVPRLSSHCHIQ